MDYKRRNGLYGYEYREPDKRRVEQRRNPGIKQLWQRSHEIVNLSAQGMKNTDIAQVLGLHPRTVSATLNGDLGKAKLSEVRYARDEKAKESVHRIAELTSMALDTYYSILAGEEEAASLKDRKDVANTVVLELSGLRAPTKTQNFSVSTTLNAEEIEGLKSRGRQAIETAFNVESVQNPNSLEG